MHLGKRGEMIDLSTLYNKKVLITGHTGFKGSWMCRLLHNVGAKVYGYALSPPTDPNLYNIANIKDFVNSEIGDIRDFNHLSKFYLDTTPDYVIHMAAQPLVRESYEKPRETYEINVMGTVNIMECIRLYGAKSFLNVTTDKVYKNIETDKYYVEFDFLDGFDPYSNSKSCSELITATYKRSFPDIKCSISTARAGNVIGGGDFAKDRIIPDCIRAVLANQEIVIRNPNSIRPYQHVLEPLFGYLSIIVSQVDNPLKAGNYNIGPRKEDCYTTGDLASLFCKIWGENANWNYLENNGPHESNYLKLDSSLIKQCIGFVPRWSVYEALDKTIEFTKVWNSGKNVSECMDRQINNYIEGSMFNV